MDGFDALLIASVKRNVSIFEKYHTRYDRKQAWIAVAQACQKSGYMVSFIWNTGVCKFNIAVEHCQIRWKSLRDRYVRETQKPAATRSNIRKFKELDFLREHIRIRR